MSSYAANKKVTTIKQAIDSLVLSDLPLFDVGSPAAVD
jgi:hypothetical protein